MEKIEIAISSKAVYEEVFKKTEYVGSKRTGEDAKLYQQARATQYNEEILSDFFREACSTADLNLRDYLTTTMGTSDLGAYKRSLRPNSRYNELLTDTLKDAMNNFFVAYITGKWLELCTFDAASEYLALAAACITDVQTKLAGKVKPKPVAQHGDGPKKEKGRLHAATTEVKRTKIVKGNTK